MTQDGPNASVTLSERAARRIAKILAASRPERSLRVSVEGGGCSGFQYRYDLVREHAGAPTTSCLRATAPRC